MNRKEEIEHQRKTVNKIATQLQKELSLPISILNNVKKFIQYAYSIGYYTGLRSNNNKYRVIIGYNYSHDVVGYYDSIEEASKETGVRPEIIENNLKGFTSKASTYNLKTHRMYSFQFRYGFLLDEKKSGESK
jgi:hypothetical protein